MTATPLRHRQPSADKLARARQAAGRASRLKGPQLSGHQIDVLPALSDLLPGRGLQVGATYCVTGSTALVAALLAGPSSAGLWCGLVGLADFAPEAALELGCDLDRLVLVPDPGHDWVNVTAALVDALPLVVAHPRGAVTHSEASRLSARLRQREGVLIVTGHWPRAELTLRVSGREWHGIGDGHGHLSAQRLSVRVEGRAALRHGSGVTDEVRDVWLPATDGSVRVDHRTRAGHSGVELVEAAG